MAFRQDLSCTQGATFRETLNVNAPIGQTEMQADAPAGALQFVVNAGAGAIAGGTIAFGPADAPIEVIAIQNISGNTVTTTEPSEYDHPAESPVTFLGPQDFTNATARMEIRRTYGAPATLAVLTSASGITLSSGQIALFLDAATTQSFNVPLESGDPPSTTFVYDLKVKFADGDTDYLIYGNFTVAASVTRASA